MLILSRKKDERIVINDDIQIQIIDVKSDVVKIGIDAPKHIKIYREEVWSTIQEENRQADISRQDTKVAESITSINQELTNRIDSHTNKDT